jgi:ABC-type transport system substrate-binding protein
MFARTAIENLVYLDETGTPVPWLATGWQVDPNAKTITLTLREGVKFHDGTDFNAEAVKWNIEQYIAGGRPELAKVTSVVVIDNYTVRLNLSENNSLIIPNLSTSAGMIISPTAYQKNGGKEWAEANPIGTGPFKFVSWERDVKQVYERFDDYWQEGKPYLDRIEWIIIADPMVQAAAFRKGDVDVIVDITPKEASTLQTEARGDYKITTTSMPTHLWGLQLDSANPNSPYSDLRVRQAVWHAFDSEAITDAFGYGCWKPLNQKAAPGSWTYNPDVKGYPYNPEKAKQLLSEAGYSDGFKTKIIGLNLPPNPEVMVAVQGYLREVGIEAEVEAMERGRFDELMVGGAHWENALMLVSASVVPDEFGLIHRLYGPQGVVTKRQAGRVLIPDEIQDILEKAATTSDSDSVKKLIHQFQQMATDKYAVQLWIFATTGAAARYARVHDDGLYEVVFTHWTPQDAWIEK